MKTCHLLTYFLYLLTILNAEPTRTRYVFLFRHINCTFNSKIVQNLHCYIEQSNSQFISTQIKYEQSIYQGYTAHFRIDVPRPNNQILNLLDLDVDVCNFFSQGETNNVIKLIYQAFAAHGNFTKCPILKGVTYGLFNWTIDVSKIPYAPEADCLVSVVLRLPQNIEVLRMHLQASLELHRRRPLIRHKDSRN